MKWVLLVSLSTTTQIPVLPFFDLGKPSMKSIETLSHFHCGTSKGWSKPPGFFCSALTCWQTKHWKTNSTALFFIPAQKKTLFMSLYILSPPGWMVILEWWASSRTAFIKLPVWGTQSLPSRRNHPFSSMAYLLRWLEVSPLLSYPWCLESVGHLVAKLLSGP